MIDFDEYYKNGGNYTVYWFATGHRPGIHLSPNLLLTKAAQRNASRIQGITEMLASNNQPDSPKIQKPEEKQQKHLPNSTKQS